MAQPKLRLKAPPRAVEKREPEPVVEEEETDLYEACPTLPPQKPPIKH